jgi:glycosyltransferase involved in cell wall biosynthesis/uncharacterized protein YjbI with pentapeptide repeats
MKRPSASTLLLFVVLLVLFVVVQVWVTIENQRRVDDAIQRIGALQTAQINDERVRQELISLGIDNAQKALTIQSIVGNIGAGIGVLAVLSGAWLGVLQYFDLRRKEQAERAANELSRLWGDLADTLPSRRASAIAGLQQFLDAGRSEFHEQVASALALVGRMDDNTPLVDRTLTPVIEKAMRSMPDVMRQVSWQGLRLQRPNFSGLALEGIDLRDSSLVEPDFTGAGLRGARFDAAVLKAARFDNADLTGARLEYADLASASLRNANLEGAALGHIKLLDADWTEAHLAGAKFSVYDTDWRLAKNWRLAHFPPELTAAMLDRYGGPVQGPCVLMLLWEFYPLVAGGGWTAAFHLLKNMRRKGAHVIVMVPWARTDISRTVFGNEIEVVAVGSTAGLSSSSYDDPSGSNNRPATSAYASTDPFSTYSVYSASMFEQVKEFAQNVTQYVEEYQIRFDLIYSHDWPTAVAAERLKRAHNKPWIAHFHSTEADRRVQPSNAIQSIEQRACLAADRIIVPSRATQARLKALYQTDRPVRVVPNCLSYDSAVNIPVGTFHAKKVLCLGRISWQKGTDLFVEIAREMVARDPALKFVVVGSGDLEKDLRRQAYVVKEDPPIVVRPAAANQDAFSFIRLNTIEPVEVDGNELVRLGTVFERGKTPAESDRSARHASLEDSILRSGFTAYAVPYGTGEGYTHRIVVAEEDGKPGRQFLVKAQGLKPVQISRTQFVEFQPNREWSKRFSVFEGMSLVIVPSRFEPYGMVILEAMQAGVPVLFPKTAGASEQLSAGIRIDPEDAKATAEQALGLLAGEAEWQRVVAEQLREINGYPGLNLEAAVIDTIQELCKVVGK